MSRRFFVLCAFMILTACANIRPESSIHGPLLIGTDRGLFRVSGVTVPVWTNASIRMIHKTSSGYYFLSSLGVIYSRDLIHFKQKNRGLPVRLLATIVSNRTFYSRHRDLYDLAFDPRNSANIVTCTKANVYYTTNGGNSWIRVHRPSPIRGITAVAIQSGTRGLTLYAAHPFKGIFKMRPAYSKKWHAIGKGLFKYGEFNEEIADIKIFHGRLYAANSFFPHLYRYEKNTQSWHILASTNILRFRAISSFSVQNNSNAMPRFFISTEKGIISLRSGHISRQLQIDNIIKSINSSGYGRVDCLFSGRLSLSGLSLSGPRLYDTRTRLALNKRALYIPTGLLRHEKSLKRILSLMHDTGLNAIVVDMKDDSGNLRFIPSLAKFKKYARYPLNLKKIMAIMKKHKIYMIARIVVFKDKRFYSYNNFANAVRDRFTLKPWQGLKINSHGKTNVIKEYWVNPYSPAVWKYNSLIACDLVARGFDEIQFDYIRFPTDGINISRLYFPDNTRNMSRVSALMSFLKYARTHIHVPISLDIYGGNGWFRSGTFTGQDVESLKNYVNVICPMFYPSHFPPNFMAEKPEVSRTWRIYYYGTYRNWIFSDKKTIIRPYVQVFSLPLKYDRKYYGPQYIRNEIRGVTEALGEGESFWNAGGKYKILRKVFTNK